MEQQNSIQELQELLELINEQTEMIQKQADDIPQLYIDMLKENILKFYEKLHILDKTKNQSLQEITQKPKATAPQKKVKPEIKTPSPSIKEVPKEKEVQEVKEVISNSPLAEEKNIEQKKDEFRLKPEPQPEKIKPTETIPEKKTPKPESKKQELVVENNGPVFRFSEPENKTSAINEPQTTIGDKLKASQDPSLAEAIQQKEIKDIKEEIGINDKFLMINELFDGNMKSYNKVIEQLNNETGLNDAIGSLNQHQTEKKWEEENEAFLKLRNFVERRYK